MSGCARVVREIREREGCVCVVRERERCTETSCGVCVCERVCVRERDECVRVCV